MGPNRCRHWKKRCSSGGNALAPSCVASTGHHKMWSWPKFQVCVQRLLWATDKQHSAHEAEHDNTSKKTHASAIFWFQHTLKCSIKLVPDSILPELASLFCHWKFEAGIPYCRAHPPGSIFNVLEYRWAVGFKGEVSMYLALKIMFGKRSDTQIHPNPRYFSEFWNILQCSVNSFGSVPLQVLYGVLLLLLVVVSAVAGMSYADISRTFWAIYFSSIYHHMIYHIRIF